MSIQDQKIPPKTHPIVAKLTHCFRSLSPDDRFTLSVIFITLIVFFFGGGL